MKEFKIDKNSADQRLDRFLVKLMPLADKNFLQKMLRKKRIKVNNSRAEAKTILVDGDRVQIYFSEETIAGFQKGYHQVTIPPEWRFVFSPPVYEDHHMLVLNKPAGLLCQPDASGELSLIDLALSYLNTPPDAVYRPGLSNRLDRNTSGIIMIPKDLPTSQAVNKAIRERHVQKTYLTLVCGSVNTPGTLKGYLEKDETQNRASISQTTSSNNKPVHLDYVPVAFSDNYTLLKVTLHTGRTHQIRAQFAAFGHPVVGDPKYGNGQDASLCNTFGLTHQLLHSLEYAIPEMDYCFNAPIPRVFKKVIQQLFGKVVI